MLASIAHTPKLEQRLVWPLHKDDTQIREAVHIFVFKMVKKKKIGDQEVARIKIIT